MSEAAISLDPRFSNRKRQPGLDLLRALAVVMVTVYHAGTLGFALPHDWQRFGWIGVDLFFVLSGYLIGGQLLASLARTGKINFRRFYARRALRILPAYLVILTVYFLWPAGREYPAITPWWKFLLSVQNIGLHGGTAFSHAWSLAVEDQFYLVLPGVLLWCQRRRPARIGVPCLVFAGGLVLRAVIGWLHPGAAGISGRSYQTWIYYFTGTRLDPLACGVVLAAVEQNRPTWWKRVTDGAHWLWLPGLAAIAGGLWLGDDDITVTTCVWQFPCVAFGMAALLVCAVSPRLPFGRVEVPGAAFLASIAYSTYLSHKLVIHFVSQWCASHGIALTSATALLLTQLSIYATGAAFFCVVERPFLQLRHRMVR